jgi:hypothetical protein
MDKSIDVVAPCEASDYTGLVFSDATTDIIGHADIKRAAVPAGKNVDVEYEFHVANTPLRVFKNIVALSFFNPASDFPGAMQRAALLRRTGIPVLRRNTIACGDAIAPRPGNARISPCSIA